VIDNRGTGRSDAPRVPWRMSTMADDVAAVLDAAGAPSAVVVGISLGGMVAQHVAIRHPTRVDGLVLLATMAGIGSGRLPSARAVSWFLTLPFGRRGARNLARLLLPEAELPRAREHFAGWRHVIRAEPLSARAFVYHLGAVLTHSTRRELATIRCPTVIVAGAADVLVPPRNSELLANAIPGATLELLPGVAHGIPILDPQIVHRTLRRIRGHVRGS